MDIQETTVPIGDEPRDEKMCVMPNSPPEAVEAEPMTLKEIGSSAKLAAGRVRQTIEPGHLYGVER